MYNAGIFLKVHCVKINLNYFRISNIFHQNLISEFDPLSKKCDKHKADFFLKDKIL